MNMDEAQRLVAGQPAPTISEHRAVLAEKYTNAPQRGTAIDLAMRQIEEGLAVLAAHGHVYALVESEPGPGETFPMMLYRGPGEQLTVEGAVELDEAKEDGWREEQAPPEGPSPEVGPGPEAVGETSQIEAVHPPEEQPHSEPVEKPDTFNAPLFPVTVIKGGDEKIVNDQSELDAAITDGWQEKQGTGPIVC